MTTTNLIEYNLTSETVNCTHVSNKIVTLLESKDNIAAISASPALLESIGVAIGEKDIALSSLSRCGTYIEVLMLECAMAIENGAEEIEVVVDISNADEAEIGETIGELTLLNDEIEAEALLKVDFSFNRLNSAQQTQNIINSLCSCGVDFLVFNLQSYNSELLELALNEIKNQSIKQDTKIGVKFKNVENEAHLIAFTTEILGQEWINPDLFRIERVLNLI